MNSVANNQKFFYLVVLTFFCFCYSFLMKRTYHITSSSYQMGNVEKGQKQCEISCLTQSIISAGTNSNPTPQIDCAYIAVTLGLNAYRRSKDIVDTSRKCWEMKWMGKKSNRKAIWFQIECEEVERPSNGGHIYYINQNKYKKYENW